MKKRFLFYLIQTVAIVAIIYCSFYLYWRRLPKTTSFFTERIGNVVLIFSLIFLLSNLFDLVSYRRFINKDYEFVRELFLILGKVFIIILIVSFIEFFLFYKTKIGRVIYVNLYFLVSLFFIVESIVLNLIIGGKKQKLLWLSSTPFLQVEKEYLINHMPLDITEYKKEPTIKDGYDYTIYDYPPKDHQNISELLHTIISIKNPMDLVTYIEETVERIPLRYVDEVWLLKNIRTFETAYDKLRRIFNFFASIILLVILFPIACIFALLHKVLSKGPLFFIQQRVGYKGGVFNLIKFRTMIKDAEKDGPKFSGDNDPRVTKIGKVMRIFRLDEVPQLINVVKGDMNLIGPRPERGAFIDLLVKKIPYYKLRLEVRPGLTGWAQVNFPYAGSIIDDHLKKLEYDFYYIKNRGLPLDILIIFKTIKTMLTRGGM